MIKEAIDRILDLQRPSTFMDCEKVERTSGGATVAPKGIPQTFGSSLDSVADIATRFIDDGEVCEIECSRDMVSVFVIETYNSRTFRHDIHIAKPILPEPFRFSVPMDPEDFIIKASDFFERNENYKAMIALVSSITKVSETVVDDDGVSQTVTFKNRIGRKDAGTVNPYVKLRAHRTFREVKQPEAEFLLRFNTGNNGPLVALHEASGYLWKTEAAEAVYNYVKSFVGDISVIR